MLKEAQDMVRNKFTFRFDVVGSYKRNMITYDAKSNVGYDNPEDSTRVLTIKMKDRKRSNGLKRMICGIG